jgi:predicted MFS family arabinose efflux permease
MNSAIEPASVTDSATPPPVSFALMAALVVLTFGHILSNLLRTMPAVSIDLMARDLDSTAQKLAGLTAAYHFAFAACQVPFGVALDRYSIRSLSLGLFVLTSAGACLAALSGGPATFLAAQILLGVGTAGMLLCPMTLAARKLTPVQFGLWSGLILSLGNAGMLLSASPLAFVVERWGWRAGFWIAGGAAIVVAALMLLIVPGDRPVQSRRDLFGEMRTVLQLGASRVLRGIVIISFVSLAVQLVLRGLWAGPWLMQVKGLSRIEAGNILTLFTCALVAGPALMGLLDRKIGHRRLQLLVTQLLAAGLLVVMALGAPGGPLARAFGIALMPVSFDTGILVSIGLLVTVQPLIYAMTRQVVTGENTGKAMSAVNLAFFLGTATMQSGTGLIGSLWGLPTVLMAMGGFLAACSCIFFVLTRPSAA